jgi:crossover junction endodeoxyribonuclease RuvC
MVMGVDTAIANVGWCVARMTSTALAPVAMGVIRTQPNAKKLGIRVGDDDWARSKTIAHALREVVKQHRPHILAVEAWSPPRNAAAVGKIGRVFGVLVDMSLTDDLPVLHATPQEIKKAVTGKASAEKGEVIAALEEMFPGTLALVHHLPAGVHEHAFDALGALVTCWENEPMKVLRQVTAIRAGR